MQKEIANTRTIGKPPMFSGDVDPNGQSERMRWSQWSFIFFPQWLSLGLAWNSLALAPPSQKRFPARLDTLWEKGNPLNHDNGLYRNVAGGDAALWFMRDSIFDARSRSTTCVCAKSIAVPVDELATGLVSQACEEVGGPA